MNNIYIFSYLNLIAQHQNQTYNINKNCTLRLENISEESQIKIYSPPNKNEMLHINLKTAKCCNQYKVLKLNGDFFIEIVAINFESLSQKINTKSCEVFIYQNALRIIYQSICYTHFFTHGNENFAVEQNGKIYIFNNRSFVVFDFENKTFKKLIVEKISKNGEKIEILCKILPFLSYFLLFSININKNIVNIKKLKKQQELPNSALLPKIVFGLCSFEISDLSLFLSDKIDCKNLFNYFAKYENLIQISNNYYLYNHSQIVPIEFKINNNIIVDID